MYDPDPVLAGEIAERQTTGATGWTFCAGATALRDTSVHACSAALPEPEPLDASHFCADCRAALAAAATGGYVLADLYAEDAMQFYPVAAGAEYTIRDYTASITQDDAFGRLNVLVTGHC